MIFFNEAIKSSVYAGMPRMHSGLRKKIFLAPSEQRQTGLKDLYTKFLLIHKKTQKYTLLWPEVAGELQSGLKSLIRKIDN
jgi:hypothetical protein